MQGIVSPDGAKNSTLIQLAALSLVDDNFVKLRNIPPITDVLDTVEMLREIGYHVKYEQDEITVSGRSSKCEFSYNYGSKIRSSLAFLGPMLSKHDYVKLPMPGDDKIGPRPIDIHVSILNAFGVEVLEEDGFIIARKTRALEGQQYT